MSFHHAKVSCNRGAKALGHSIGTIVRSVVRNRQSHANSLATGCPVGATRRFTPPEPINCAGGVKAAIERD